MKGKRRYAVEGKTPRRTITLNVEGKQRGKREESKQMGGARSHTVDCKGMKDFREEGHRRETDAINKGNRVRNRE
jgi:hypothetical protein